MDDVTTPDLELTTRDFAREVEHHRTIGSTNDRAMALSKAGARHGLAVIADEQTAGRGQRGRHWRSQTGDGLYVSFVVRTALPPAQAASITLAAGVAVRRALEPRVNVALGLKWPNDVLVAGSGSTYGRKLAGVLFEAVSDQDHVQHAVLGIGINLRPPADPTLTDFATGLTALGGPDAGPRPVLIAVANHLEAEVMALEAGGQSALCARWTDAALGIGQAVRIEQASDVVAGRFVGLAPDGALTIESAGERRPVYHGRLVLPDVPRGPTT